MVDVASEVNVDWLNSDWFGESMSRDDRDSSTDGAQRGGEQARAAAEAVARRSYGKLVAFLAARTRDVAAAEDALSEAFAAALADWPVSGCPANPEGWLLTVARRKVIDMYRGQRRDELAGDELRALGFGLDERSSSERSAGDSGSTAGAGVCLRASGD